MIKPLTPLNAVTATTTSDEIEIAGAKRITWQFIRADHSAGKTVFSVEVSLDGTNYATFNKLITNVANTNSQTLIRVASYDTGTANATACYSMDLQHDLYKFMRVTATETTDGTHTAKCAIEF